ncbi:MAG TPA: universal stress protein [Thermodesulfobacteriota bacterium]|nr:universal stress protein [Thermodesulfobacteriota bacterium]
MTSIKKIAFCTDFSDNSNEAFELAVDLTVKYQARLFMVHVVPPLVFPSPVMEEFISEQASLQFYKDAIRWATEQIESVYLNKLGKSLQAEVRVLSGHPASEILNFLEQEEIDLVVMGTHGLAGLAHFFLGSTAEKVVRRASCSVLTVHPKKA